MDTLEEIYNGRGNEILSLHETALLIKEQLRLKGITAPDTSKMYGLRINDRTVFYYSTETRRDAHVEKLTAYMQEFTTEVKFETINPK